MAAKDKPSVGVLAKQLRTMKDIIPERLTLGTLVEDEEDLLSRLKGDSVVIYLASWCDPCLSLMDDLVSTFQDRIVQIVGEDVQFLYADVKTCREVAVAAGVKALPATVVYRDGDVLDMFVGNVPLIGTRNNLGFAPRIYTALNNTKK